jgi:hypothetical protein
MPSRQERRAAERDAAKRASGQAGSGGAGGAAGARANLNVNPVGDWSTQAADPGVLARVTTLNELKRRAGAGDMEAQFSLGFYLLCQADGVGVEIGSSGRSPMADVGFVCSTCVFRVASMPN